MLRKGVPPVYFPLLHRNESEISGRPIIKIRLDNFPCCSFTNTIYDTHDQATYISKKSTKVVQNKTRKLRDFLFISANKFSSSESFLAVVPSMGKDFVFSSLAASLSNSLCEIPFQA